MQRDVSPRTQTAKRLLLTFHPSCPVYLPCRSVARSGLWESCFYLQALQVCRQQQHQQLAVQQQHNQQQAQPQQHPLIAPEQQWQPSQQQRHCLQEQDAASTSGATPKGASAALAWTAPVGLSPLGRISNCLQV